MYGNHKLKTEGERSFEAQNYIIKNVKQMYIRGQKDKLAL
jgi:hypothetical protein